MRKELEKSSFPERPAGGKRRQRVPGPCGALLAVQRTAGNRAASKLVARWIEEQNGRAVENDQQPIGYWPLGGYWTAFNPKLWNEDHGYRKWLQDNRSDPPRFQPEATRLPFAGDIKGTNDLGDRLGCSNCVVADYYDMKLSKFQRAAGDPPLQGRSGVAGHKFFEDMGIGVAFETFPNVSALVKEVVDYDPEKVDDDDPDWEGALAWEGHIIRIRQENSAVRAWDPQGGLGGPSLIPSDKQLFLFTFTGGQRPQAAPAVAGQTQQ